MPRPLIANRRERVLDAAEALVLERGFDAMSVQAVADAAGIAKGAVYREFDSKLALLDAVLRRGSERMLERSRALLAGEASPALLSTAYRVGVQVLLDDALMSAAFLDDAGVLGEHVATVTDGRYRTRMVDVEAWIADLQAAGRLAADIDAAALALALSSTTLGLISAAKHFGPLSRDDLAGALTAMERLVAGLEPTPGDDDV